MPQTLRTWQAEAVAVAAATPTALIEACPGAGKTRFAFRTARTLLDDGAIDRIIVVVPSAELRNQLGRDAHTYERIELDYRFDPAAPLWSPSYHGVVVTYAAVANHPDRWAYRTAQGRTLVILDEIHHAGERDHLSWGPALREAFDGAARKLLLSGTPFRTDGAEIPWVTYDSTGTAVPDYQYRYTQAVADGVVRPIRFDLFDTDVQWSYNGAETRTTLAEAAADDESRALRTALDPHSLQQRRPAQETGHDADTLSSCRRMYSAVHGVRWRQRRL
jgi:superfamily II DNA or RNA helicase